MQTAKAILSEQGRPVGEWVQVMPLVQWALNSAYRQRYDSTPYELMLGRKPSMAFSAVLGKSEDGVWTVNSYDPDRVQEKLKQLARVREELQEGVTAKVDRRHQQARDSKVTAPWRPTKLGFLFWWRDRASPQSW